jgi:hypothetical protein
MRLPNGNQQSQEFNMADYDNTNRGALFKNKRKEQPTHADWTGRINVDGQDYYLNSWTKEKDGDKYLSISVKPVVAKEAAPARPVARATPRVHAELDDEVPF